MIAVRVPVPSSRNRDLRRGRLFATADLATEDVRSSRHSVRVEASAVCGDVDAVVAGDQIVQPRREDGKICAQNGELHGYASVWSVVWTERGLVY